MLSFLTAFHNGRGHMNVMSGLAGKNFSAVCKPYHVAVGKATDVLCAAGPNHVLVSNAGIGPDRCWKVGPCSGFILVESTLE